MPIEVTDTFIANEKGPQKFILKKDVFDAYCKEQGAEIAKIQELQSRIEEYFTRYNNIRPENFSQFKNSLGDYMASQVNTIKKKEEAKSELAKKLGPALDGTTAIQVASATNVFKNEDLMRVGVEALRRGARERQINEQINGATGS